MSNLQPENDFPDGNALDAEIDRLYGQVRSFLVSARSRAARSVNAEMVRAYWSVGEALVEQEQKGKGRAGYGERLVESLAERFDAERVSGMSAGNLWWTRSFYLLFPFLNALRSELSWTHYCLLLKVDDPEARLFYEREAAQQCWSTRQLERRIGSLFYERAALSPGKREILAESRAGAERYSPEEFVKDPSVLEFLGLPPF